MASSANSSTVLIFEYRAGVGLKTAISSTGMAIETAKSCIILEPGDNGGMAVKVESSYKLLPAVARVEQAHAVVGGGGGGATNFKVKVD